MNKSNVDRGSTFKPSPNMVELSGLRCASEFIGAVPGDSIRSSGVREVLGACYSRVTPEQAPGPQLVAYSPHVAEPLGLDAATCESEAFREVFSGNALVDGMTPFAMCYGGHQFGHWAGQLGDGRAINLGEAMGRDGLAWALQLKGAGPTPYSRRGDGYAVLRSSLREFLCSEAMHHLGVPTTRALSLTLTGNDVIRDMLYDGHPKAEPGAIVCRVARSFLRFGSFEIFAARGDHERLRMLAEYVRDAFYSGMNFAEMLAEIARRTAVMIAHWQRVGFVHGVMNTDNMSILGDTIDYGPYGWLEPYNPDWTPNTTDAANKRYRYANQPAIGAWNVLQLARAMHPLIDGTDLLEAALELYERTYIEQSQNMQAQKLGFVASSTAIEERVVEPLRALLAETETDFTIFYRNLAKVDLTAMLNEHGMGHQESGSAISDASGIGDLPTSGGADSDTGGSGNSDARNNSQSGWSSGGKEWGKLAPAFYRPETLDDDLRSRYRIWFMEYAALLRQNGVTNAARVHQMNSVNPKYVPRNYLAQEAIDAIEAGDASVLATLMNVLQRPYDEQPEFSHLAVRRPDWAANRAGCSMLSCSS